MTSSRHHIYLSSNRWEGLWIIQQPLCQEIGRTEPVLYVEQLSSVFSVLRRPSEWRRLIAWIRGARPVGNAVRVLAPLPLFHLGHRFPRLLALELRIQRRWILFWAKRMSGSSRVLWLDNPVYQSLIGRMGEAIAVYHVGDDISAFETTHAPTMTRLEERTLRKADLVFAAAQHLADARRPLNANTFPIANAIDPDAFRAEPSEATLTLLHAIPAPRVALIGVMDHWVDVELIATTARALPHLSFVVVGPWRVDAAAVRDLANVHLLGPRDRREIAGILRRCSASLVPFKRIPLTERIMPVKIYEALAAGILPVASDFSSEISVLAATGMVWVGKTTADFVALVGEAVSSDTASRRASLSAFGLRQTWASRWAEIDGILRRHSASVDGVPAVHASREPGYAFQ